MSGLSVLVFSEGSHELGGRKGESLVPDAQEREQKLPALPRIIHRVLGGPRDITYTCKVFKNVLAGHGKDGKFAKKVKVAMYKSRKDGFDATVILIDRDREADKERIGKLRSGRDAASNSGIPIVPCAVGVAVETFDAWMIADGGAIKFAGGDAGQSHPSPENLNGKKNTVNHPKERAYAAFGGPSELDVRYAAVAEHVDLNHLERACPLGFKPFADDVRDKIGLLLPRTRT